MCMSCGHAANNCDIDSADVIIRVAYNLTFFDDLLAYYISTAVLLYKAPTRAN